MNYNKRKRICISDFGFKFSGYGHYEVTYYSPVTNKMFTTRTNDIPLIDLTKNCENPKVKDLERLKNISNKLR